MSKSNHTPGPWGLSYNHRRTKLRDNLAFVSGGLVVIAKCDGDDAHANAALIASAPDLLAALEQIAKLGGNLPDERLETATGPNDARGRGLMVTTARAIARAAIAKAKGTP